MNEKFDSKSFFKTTRLHTFTEFFMWFILLNLIFDNQSLNAIKILIGIFFILDIFVYFFNLFVSKYKKCLYANDKVVKKIIYLSIIENVLGIFILGLYGLGVFEFVLSFILAGSIWTQAKIIECINEENNCEL